MGNAQSVGAGGGRLSGLLTALNTPSVPLTVKSPLFHELAELTNLTAEEVFASLPTPRLRRALKNRDNTVGLTRGLVRELRVRLKLSAAELQTAYNASSLVQTVRLLTRIVPLILEDPALNERVFWSGQDPLGPGLVETVVQLCFLPGFTVSPDAARQSHAYTTKAAAKSPHKSVAPAAGNGDDGAAAPASSGSGKKPLSILPASHVWAAGIGVADVFPCSGPMSLNRVEVLRLLLVCLSEDMFSVGRQPQQPGAGAAEGAAAASGHNRLLQHLCSRPSYHSLGLLLSLLNSGISFDPNAGSFFSGGAASDTAQELATLSLQTACVLLQFGLPTIAPGSGATPSAAAGPAPVPASPSKFIGQQQQQQLQHRGINVFTKYLSNLELDDVELLLSNIIRLLRLAPLQPPGYFGSAPQFAGTQELLLLLFRILHEAPAHIALLVRRLPVLDLAGILLTLMAQGRHDSTDLSQVHLCAFLLLMLSGERDFGVALNQPVPPVAATAAAVDPGTATGADFLVLTVVRLFVDGQPKLVSIYECLLTVVANVSPYITDLGALASAKLVQLFCFLARDKYIFGAENNHRLVAFLLETFNNQIQYQYKGAMFLTYNLVQRCEQVVQLANLALPEGDGAAAKQNAAAASAAHPRHANLIDPSFVPTQHWLTSWKNELPFGTVLRLLDHLVPLTQRTRSSTEMAVIELIRATNVVGLLPVPHPLLARKYAPNPASNSFYLAALWAAIYLSNIRPPLFYGTNVHLFHISVEEE